MLAEGFEDEAKRHQRYRLNGNSRKTDTQPMKYGIQRRYGERPGQAVGNRRSVTMVFTF